jgi:hypothetical protein
MALPQYTIEFHQGETYVLSITYKDSTGCAVDLSSGYTAQIDGRASSALKWRASTEVHSPVVGTIVLSKGSPNIKVTLADTYTASLDLGSGVWDLLLENSTPTPDTSEYLLGGTYTISDPVTPDVTT